jgi:hypothetical protein
MELVEGESLRERLQRGRRSTGGADRAGDPVGVSALRDGHVHRDVKLGNVLLDGEGRAARGLGLVRRWDADTTRATSSLAGRRAPPWSRREAK